jgi:phosphoglycolate phosphatase
LSYSQPATAYAQLEGNAPAKILGLLARSTASNETILTKMHYQAVLFDLDGTLLDTLDDLANSMNSVLQRWGFAVHDREAYKYFVGNGMENLARRALPPEQRRDAMIVKCVTAMREEYALRWSQHSRPYDGIPDLLNALVGRRLQLAILSNKPADFVNLMVANLLGAWRFESVRGVLPAGPVKPDPQAALEIAAQLKIPPPQFIYVGDTSTDMQTATAAGMFAVGALWGFRQADELLAGGAKILLKTPMELLNLL